MTNKPELDRLFEELRKEFVRCIFPNGRAAYMREFEEKFETSLANVRVGGGIDRSAQSFWKTHD